MISIVPCHVSSASGTQKSDYVNPRQPGKASEGCWHLVRGLATSSAVRAYGLGTPFPLICNEMESSHRMIVQKSKDLR